MVCVRFCAVLPYILPMVLSKFDRAKLSWRFRIWRKFDGGFSAVIGIVDMFYFSWY